MLARGNVDVSKLSLEGLVDGLKAYANLIGGEVYASPDPTEDYSVLSLQILHGDNVAALDVKTDNAASITYRPTEQNLHPPIEKDSSKTMDLSEQFKKKNNIQDNGDKRGLQNYDKKKQNNWNNKSGGRNQRGNQDHQVAAFGNNIQQAMLAAGYTVPPQFNAAALSQGGYNPMNFPYAWGFPTNTAMGPAVAALPSMETKKQPTEDSRGKRSEISYDYKNRNNPNQGNRGNYNRDNNRDGNRDSNRDNRSNRDNNDQRGYRPNNDRRNAPGNNDNRGYRNDWNDRNKSTQGGNNRHNRDNKGNQGFRGNNNRDFRGNRDFRSRENPNRDNRNERSSGNDRGRNTAIVRTKSEGNGRFIFCFTCGRPDHISPDCPIKQQAIGVMGNDKRLCATCKKWGHYEFECPDKKGN